MLSLFKDEDEVQAYNSKSRKISIKCGKPVIYWLYAAVSLFGETSRQRLP